MSESGFFPCQLCHDQVSRLDHDRFVIAMAAPPATRQHLMALFAFNSEVAAISESVSETMLGQMRLQWWREQVDAASSGGPRPAGIAGDLHDTIRHADLSPELFYRFLAGRERDLEAGPPESLDCLVRYCEDTSATLTELALNVSGHQSREGAVSQVARHSGIAWALIGLIRSMPYHTERARCFMPRDMLAAAGIDWHDMNIPKNRLAVPSLVAPLANVAAEHEVSARRLSRDIPADALAPLLVLPLIRHYVHILNKAGFNVYDPRVQQKHSIRKTLHMMWASWRNRM